MYRPRKAHKPAGPEESSNGDVGSHTGEDQCLLPDQEPGSSCGSTPLVLLRGYHHPGLVQTGLFWFYWITSIQILLYIYQYLNNWLSDTRYIDLHLRIHKIILHVNLNIIFVQLGFCMKKFSIDKLKSNSGLRMLICVVATHEGWCRVEGIIL